LSYVFHIIFAGIAAMGSTGTPRRIINKLQEIAGREIGINNKFQKVIKRNLGIRIVGRRRIFGRHKVFLKSAGVGLHAEDQSPFTGRYPSTSEMQGALARATKSLGPFK
jgi:hypothetical protein